MEYILAPSILAADFKNLGCEMKKTEENGAEYLHVDVRSQYFIWDAGACVDLRGDRTGDGCTPDDKGADPLYRRL